MESYKSILTGLAGQFTAPFTDWWSGVDGRGLIPALVFTALICAFRKPLATGAVRMIAFTGRTIGLTVSQEVQDTIKPAAQAMIVALALLIGMDALNLPEVINGAVRNALASVAVAAVFMAMYSLTDVFAGLLTPYRTSRTAIQVDWIVMIAKAAVGILGLSAVLKIWAIDLGPVLTGMGVLGAGVALAAQDLFKNLLAGFTNMSEKRFQVGDWIRVDGVIEGVVERMEFRSALVRRFDMAPVFVPNAELANASLTNFSRMPHRRIYWKISLVYSASETQLSAIRDAIDTYIAQSEDFVPPPEASRYIRIDSFSDSSIDLMVYCFTRSTAYADYLEVKERLALAIKQAVEEAGSAFAFPSSSIYVEAGPWPASDPFTPSQKSTPPSPAQ